MFIQFAVIVALSLLSKTRYILCDLYLRKQVICHISDLFFILITVLLTFFIEKQGKCSGLFFVRYTYKQHLLYINPIADHAQRLFAPMP
jgi:hypothetical protein